MAERNILTAEVDIKDNWVHFQCPHCLKDWYGNKIREEIKNGEVIICGDGSSLRGCGGKIKLVPSFNFEVAPVEIFSDDGSLTITCSNCGKTWHGEGVTIAQKTGRLIVCGQGLVGLGCGRILRVI